jgi:para-nitrobenzyl esterase
MLFCGGILNRRLRLAFSLANFIFSVAFFGCGGGSPPPPPQGCQNTATIKCTQSGAVQGVAAGSLYVFRSIPYAAPPVGNLRWKEPQAVASWKGVRDASTFGNVCTQFNFGGQLVGNEDCLTLHVYVPQNPPGQKMPVMVFLHGGGNSQGDPQSTTLDMSLLALQGVVVVTVQYRLGMLGFFANAQLTSEGGGSSGHYALADQVAALKWVQSNIAEFGGDPKKVMLFGASAGGWDVETLLAAPSAQGLFWVAAIESGPVPAERLPSLSNLEAADLSFVAAAGCSGAPDVLACMRAVPADSIVNLQTPYRFYSAVGSPFLPTDPFLALQQNGSPVPFLIGTNREEWTLFDRGNLGIDTTAYGTLVHQEFDALGVGVANQVLTLYPAAAFSTPGYALVGVDTDWNMTCETRNIARAASGPHRKPVWRYLYTHVLENDAALQTLRAFHGQELFVLFGNFSSLSSTYAPTPAEVALTSTMMGYWTRFAATGDPNGAGAVAWPEYDALTDSMLQIDDTQVAINGYNNTQCDYFSMFQMP